MLVFKKQSLKYEHFENDEISAKVGLTKNQISQKALRSGG
jgi:hypothetical protein